MEELIELDYENLDRKNKKYFLGKKELVELGRADLEYHSGSGIEDWIGQERAIEMARRNREIPEGTTYYAVVSVVDISRGSPMGKMSVIFFKLKKA